MESQSMKDLIIQELDAGGILSTSALAKNLNLDERTTRQHLEDLWNSQKIGRRRWKGEERWHLPGYKPKSYPSWEKRKASKETKKRTPATIEEKTTELAWFYGPYAFVKDPDGKMYLFVQWEGYSEDEDKPRKIVLQCAEAKGKD